VNALRTVENVGRTSCGEKESMLSEDPFTANISDGGSSSTWTIRGGQPDLLGINATQAHARCNGPVKTLTEGKKIVRMPSTRQSNYDWDIRPLEPLSSTLKERWDYSADLRPCDPAVLGIDELHFELQIFGAERDQSEEI